MSTNCLVYSLINKVLSLKRFLHTLYIKIQKQNKRKTIGPKINLTILHF